VSRRGGRVLTGGVEKTQGVLESNGVLFNVQGAKGGGGGKVRKHNNLTGTGWGWGRVGAVCQNEGSWGREGKKKGVRQMEVSSDREARRVETGKCLFL